MENSHVIMGESVPNVVAVMGESTTHCGYCGSTEETSVSYGMHAEYLTVYAYQNLIDRYVVLTEFVASRRIG